MSASWFRKLKPASFKEISKQFIESDAYHERGDFLTRNSAEIFCSFLTVN